MIDNEIIKPKPKKHLHKNVLDRSLAFLNISPQGNPSSHRQPKKSVTICVKAAFKKKKITLNFSFKEKKITSKNVTDNMKLKKAKTTYFGDESKKREKHYYVTAAP